MSASILAELLQKAEVELVDLRRRRSELESAERVAGEKVGHLRAALELETNGAARQVGKESASPASAPGSTTMRPEDLAAEILSERSPMHYKDLYAECQRRGGVIVSANPAAVLLTRISRDDRFHRASQRGVYALAGPEDGVRQGKQQRRRHHKRRPRTRRSVGVVA